MSVTIDDKEYLTVKEISRKLKLPKEKVYNIIRQKEIPHKRVEMSRNERILVEKDNIDLFKKNNKLEYSFLDRVIVKSFFDVETIFVIDTNHFSGTDSIYSIITQNNDKIGFTLLREDGKVKNDMNTVIHGEWEFCSYIGGLEIVVQMCNIIYDNRYTKKEKYYKEIFKKIYKLYINPSCHIDNVYIKKRVHNPECDWRRFETNDLIIETTKGGYLSEENTSNNLFCVENGVGDVFIDGCQQIYVEYGDNLVFSDGTVLACQDSETWKNTGFGMLLRHAGTEFSHIDQKEKNFWLRKNIKWVTINGLFYDIGWLTYEYKDFRNQEFGDIYYKIFGENLKSL